MRTLWEFQCSGRRAIGVSRCVAPKAGFTTKQIELVTTFADQAVIAIENVRLFKELQARNADITEALQQQTSIAEILRVISSTPTDVMPVLEAVTHRAAQLCDAPDARLYLVEGDSLKYVVGFGESAGAHATLPLSRGLVMGRAIIDRSVMHIQDLAAAFDEFPEARDPQQQFGNRTTLAVPMVREGRVRRMLLRGRSAPVHGRDERSRTFAEPAPCDRERAPLQRDRQSRASVANRTIRVPASMSHELRTSVERDHGSLEMMLARMRGDLNAKQPGSCTTSFSG